MISGNLAGKYRLLATLGHGGMADVYLACAEGPAGINKLLVVKELRPVLAQDPDFLDMFLDEARLAARLSHPNIVQTYEALASDGRYFIAMEYLDGQPFNRILAEQAKRGELSWLQGLRIVSEALCGLHYAHELRDYSGEPLQLVHRDVTPHNLLVTYDGQVKLVDFGIAKVVSSATETRVGMLKGKVGYMAPEQARADAIDRRTDVYGMGVVLWELLARRRMWRSTPDVVILSRLAAGDVPALAAVALDVPPELQLICSRATAAEPRDRFQSAHEFRVAIDEYLHVHEPAGDLRSVGSLVAESFAAERERMRSVIQLQLLDTTRLPAVLEHTPTSRSGSLDPRHDPAAAWHLTPSPTPAEFVVNIPGPAKQDVDTTVFPKGPRPRRWRPLWGGALALSAGAVALLFGVLREPSPVKTHELSGALGSDTTLSAGRVYVLKSTLRVRPGVTLTIEPGAQVSGEPGAGAVLVLEPGARLVSPR